MNVRRCTKKAPKAYRGPDRRGVIRALNRPVSVLYAASMMAGVVAVPFGILTVSSVLRTEPGPWSTGVADAAFVAFSISAALLLFRWRLVGDAACVSLASAAAVVGVFFVPAATRPVAMSAGIAASLRIVSIAIVVPLTVSALYGPEVRGDLRPVRSFVSTLLIALAIALALGVSPARGLLEASPGGFRLFDLAAAILSIVLSGMALIEGLRRRRLLFVGLAAFLLSVSAASGAIAAGASGPWQSASALFLLAGAVQFIAVVGGELQPAINAVLIHDVRGRRRWEAAEAKLTEAHSRIRVQRHDVNSMLSAIDGTLLVLTAQRDELADHDIDRLLSAVREEVHWLQADLNTRSDDDRSYDLSEVVTTVVSVRDSGQTKVRCELQPGIELRGRPDRVAVAIDNLLANAAIHAPMAQVTVRTRSVTGTRGECTEIAVIDSGPGLSDLEMSLAFERGWRGAGATGKPGSGLGLGQCRDLVEAEGGVIELHPTDPFAVSGNRGLTVRITIPTNAAKDSGRLGSRPVQMRVLEGGVAI